MNELETYQIAEANVKTKDELIAPALNAMAMYLRRISDPSLVNQSSLKEASSIMDTLISLLKIIADRPDNDEDTKELLNQFKELLNGKES